MQQYTHTHALRTLCFLAYLCGIVWAWASLARQALRGGARQAWGYLLDAAVVVPLIMWVHSFKPASLDATTFSFAVCLVYARLGYKPADGPAY